MLQNVIVSILWLTRFQCCQMSFSKIPIILLKNQKLPGIKYHSQVAKMWHLLMGYWMKTSGVSMKHLKRLLEQVQQLKSPIFVENSQIGQTSLILPFWEFPKSKKNHSKGKEKSPYFGIISESGNTAHFETLVMRF